MKKSCKTLNLYKMKKTVGDFDTFWKENNRFVVLLHVKDYDEKDNTLNSKIGKMRKIELGSVAAVHQKYTLFGGYSHNFDFFE